MLYGHLLGIIICVPGNIRELPYQLSAFLQSCPDTFSVFLGTLEIRSNTFPVLLEILDVCLDHFRAILPISEPCQTELQCSWKYMGCNTGRFCPVEKYYKLGSVLGLEDERPLSSQWEFGALEKRRLAWTIF